MGIRSSLIPVLIDFLSGRSMKLKFNGKQGGPWDLVGGSPQGSFLGQMCYTTGSYDNTDQLDIDEDNKFQYIDDLDLLELIILTDVLIQYNFREHVASDIGIGQRFLPPTSTKTQSYHDEISIWTQNNLMKLNSEKSKYMLHTRTRENFATRFSLEGCLIDRETATKVLGVWVGEDPSCWDINTQQIMKRSYASMSILTKLKYAGLSREKLIHIYSLHVRSSMEYCSVVWHDNLTQAQSNSIERLQIVALKIILGNDCPRKDDGHFDYSRALTLCQLETLFSRREKRALSFGKKCIKHPTMKRLFPLNPAMLTNPYPVRSREPFYVNHARTAAYSESAIPAIQRRLNKHYASSPP